MVAVAQLVRALLCESRGREFESRQPPIFSSKFFLNLVKINLTLICDFFLLIIVL